MSEQHNPTVGFIGAGRMGQPMVRRLAGAGVDVVALGRRYGNPIPHLGPLGSGQRVKLLNNLLFAVNMHPRGSRGGNRRLMAGPLHGQTALVTGGGRGIGRGIALALVFLCSEEAGFVTGTTLPVDGGRSYLR